MQPTIFTKNHSLTSKGHHEGQKLLKRGMLNFIDPKRKKKTILDFYAFIIKLEALLMLKMVLQYEFGQIVFEWFKVKNHVRRRICHFYVKIAHGELLASALSQ